MNDVADQIAEMLDAGGPKVTETETETETEQESTEEETSIDEETDADEGTEEEETSSSKEEEEESSEEETEETEEDKESGEGDSSESDKSDADDSDDDDKLAIVSEERDKLRKLVDKMSAKETEDKIEDQTISPDPTDYIGDEEVSDITYDKESFNKFLQGFASKIEQTATEKLLRSVPDIVKTNVLIQTKLKALTDDFYESNSDLLPFRRAVASVAEELMADNPDWKMEKVFSKTGVEARKRLQLKEQVKKKSNSLKNPSGRRKFPKTSGGRRPVKSKPNTSKLLTDIDVMNKSI